MNDYQIAVLALVILGFIVLGVGAWVSAHIDGDGAP